VLDIGCSIGIYSAIALFADLYVEVIAFDSDLESLAAARRLCRHAQGDRLQLVHGFLTKEATETTTLVKAVALTDEALKQSNVQGDFGANRFICLTDLEATSIPHRRIDDLFATGTFEMRSMLIKCDVEGAEYLVLSGGEKLLRRAHPDLLLSVHPPALPNYGHFAEDVRAFLKGLGYDIRCLAVDHEEHWWCHFKGNA
jgi:FkbM family methyltransferase